MLSICIPVFNQDVTHLVHVLNNQLEDLDVEAEIMVLDDHSEEEYKILNRSVQTLPSVTYEELGENLGRSRIRNLLSKRARFDGLLYLDCDTLIIKRNFLQNYLEHFNGQSVVCGGHLYGSEPPGSKYILHWKTGTKREIKSLSVRQAHPYRTFMTGNFLIRKDVFKSVKFHEGLAGYGHEDTLFAFGLKQAGIPVKHIDNPILHKGLESSHQFLRKTREGLRNLNFIVSQTGTESGFEDMSRVLTSYRRLKAMRLTGLLGFVFTLLHRQLERNLHGRKPLLSCFDLYKLGVFHLIVRSGPNQTR